MPKQKRVFKYEHWRGLTTGEFEMLSKWEQREYNKLIKKKNEREKKGIHN